MLLVRWAAGPLVVLSFAFAFLFSAPEAWARAPEPGDKVKITLHDGNNVVGELLGLSESGYRVSFGGMEVIVAYPSVQAIEVLVEDSLLDEMRPDARADPRGRSEPTFGEPPNRGVPRASESAPPYRSPPERHHAPRAAPAPSAPPRDPTPPPGRYAPRRNDDRPRARASREPDQSANLDVPPKPRSRGGGLMVTGFVLLGVGGSMAVGSALAADDGYRDGSEVFLPAVTATGAIMATAGLVMGVTGIIIKSVSGSRRRRWERQYGGGLDLRPESIAVVPTLSRDGDGGVALLATF